ncbi:MAG: hypothetical protein U0165_06770 [Polyangiaceae bacterium]
MTERQITGWVDFATLIVGIVVHPVSSWLVLEAFRRARRDRELAPCWHRSTLWAALAPLLFLPNFLCVGFYVWVDLRRTHRSRRIVRAFAALASMALSLLIAVVPLVIVGAFVEAVLSP